MELLKLKEEGKAPEWLTEEGYKTLKGGYLLDGETPLDLYRRVSIAVADYYNPEIVEELFEILWNGYIGLSTPVAANMGTDRGFPISCYGLIMEDSINGIFNTVHEVASLSSRGGGIAVHLNNIRGTGVPISKGGTSDGVVPWCKIIDSTTIAVNQGGSIRRGATAIYLSIDHPDFNEFLRIRRPTGDVNRQCVNIHNAVNISDNFMNRVISGDNIARNKWLDILYTRIETGEPYIFFEDTVNEDNPQIYKDRGFKVNGSNLCCLTGDTLVETKEGAVPIKNLVGRTVSIFDGEEWVENSNFLFTGNSPVIEIKFQYGNTIKCTENHRWFVASSLKDARANKYVETYSTDLKVGDYVEPYNLKEGDRIPRIISIKQYNTEYETYCTKVNTTGKFALSIGVMTGNSEITLMTDNKHSFVCCLSSINLARTPSYMLEKVTKYGILLLDAVMSEFIKKATEANDPILNNTLRFAKKSRALGLGVLGYHTLLQNLNIPFESEEARKINLKIFSTIQRVAQETTKELAKELGEPQWCRGYGVRNTHLLSCAPTVSNSIICGNVSQGIEPLTSNSYIKNTAKGIFIYQNPTLKRLLASKNKDDQDIWTSITTNKGSVKHLSFLTDTEKAVFKTAREISQFEIVNQASDRQQFIDQSQSVNLFFSIDSNPNYINKVHLSAWSKRLKTLYYCRSESIQSITDSISTPNTSTTASCSIDSTGCTSCDG